MIQPNCKDKTQEMFPPESRNISRRQRNKPLVVKAKSICKDCPLANQCLKLAVESGETCGVWGGIWFADHEDIRNNLGKTLFNTWSKNRYHKPGLRYDHRI